MSPRTLVWGVWLLGLTTGVLAVLGLRAWHERGAQGDLERFAAVRAFAEEFVEHVVREALNLFMNGLASGAAPKVQSTQATSSQRAGT